MWLVPTAAHCATTARKRSNAPSIRPAANSTASSVNLSPEPSSYPHFPRTKQKVWRCWNTRPGSVKASPPECTRVTRRLASARADWRDCQLQRLYSEPHQHIFRSWLATEQDVARGYIVYHDCCQYREDRDSDLPSLLPRQRRRIPS